MQPETGIVLDCCGTPTRTLGDKAGFERIREHMVNAVTGLGTNKLILACPDCLHTINTQVPELEATTLYQTMVQLLQSERNSVRSSLLISLVIFDANSRITTALSVIWNSQSTICWSPGQSTKRFGFGIQRRETN